MSRKPTRNRRLMVESLESRSMLAGSISATVTDGVLDIFGDGDLRIHQLPQTYTGARPGVKLELLGKSNGNQQTTTINGESSVILTGIKSGANINAQAMHLVIGNSSTYGGSPTVRKTSVALPGIVNITEAFDARMYIENYTKVTINGSSNGDNILIGGKLSELDVNANAAVNGGGNIVRIVALRAASTVNIDLGGSPTSGLHQLHMDSAFGSTFNGALNITTVGHSLVFVGPGSDVHPVTFNGPVAYQGGGNRDSVRFDGVDINASFVVDLGGGNDGMVFKNAHALGVSLDGGLGTDGLSIQENTDLGTETITGFETIER